MLPSFRLGYKYYIFILLFSLENIVYKYYNFLNRKNIADIKKIIAEGDVCMDNTYEVVGVRHGLTKEGKKPFTVLHVFSDFDDYMKANGCNGKKAENVYIASNLDITVGEIVELVYGVGFGGKAIVTNAIAV